METKTLRRRNVFERQSGLVRDSPYRSGSVPSFVNFSEAVKAKKGQLNTLTANWSSLPEAYRFATDNDNEDLFRALSRAEFNDLYSRIMLYRKVARTGFSPDEIPEIDLLERAIRLNPVLSRNPLRTIDEAVHESRGLPTSMYMTCAYRDAYLGLGKRFEGKN